MSQVEHHVQGRPATSVRVVVPTSFRPPSSGGFTGLLPTTHPVAAACSLLHLYCFSAPRARAVHVRRHHHRLGCGDPGVYLHFHREERIFFVWTIIFFGRSKVKVREHHSCPSNYGCPAIFSWPRQHVEPTMCFLRWHLIFFRGLHK